MARTVLALEYPRPIDPADLVQVLEGPAAELGVVAIGVSSSLERRREWRKLEAQLQDLEIELRWEGLSGVYGP